jgi:hypothetical protein
MKAKTTKKYSATGRGLWKSKKKSMSPGVDPAIAELNREFARTRKRRIKAAEANTVKLTGRNRL